MSPDINRGEPRPIKRIAASQLVPGTVLVTRVDQKGGGFTEERIRFEGADRISDRRGRERLAAVFTRDRSGEENTRFDTNFYLLLKGRVGRAKVTGIESAEILRNDGPATNDLSYEAAVAAAAVRREAAVEEVRKTVRRTQDVFIVPRDPDQEAVPAMITRVDDDVVYMFKRGPNGEELVEVAPETLVNGGKLSNGLEVDIIPVPPKFHAIVSPAADIPEDTDEKSKELKRAMNKKEAAQFLGDPSFRTEDHVDVPTSKDTRTVEDVKLRDVAQKEIGAADLVKIIMKDPLNHAKRVLNGVYIGIVDGPKRALFGVVPDGTMEQASRYVEQGAFIFQLPMDMVDDPRLVNLVRVPEVIARQEYRMVE